MAELDETTITALIDEAHQPSDHWLNPVAMKFTSEKLEKQFLQFLQPARSLTIILFLISTVVSLHNLVDGIPTLAVRGVPLVVQVYRIFVTLSVTLCLVSDAAVWVLHRKCRYFTDLQQSEWCHLIRSFYIFVLTGSGLNLSLESWDCAAEAAGRAALKLCFSGLPWWTYASLLFAVFLGVRLPIHVCRLSIFIVGEAALAIVGPLKQPNEERFVRPLYGFILCAIYLPIYNWRERDDRRRFLIWKSLSFLRVQLSQDKTATASLLTSICDRSQLDSLLRGESIRNKADLAAVLILDIHDFALWRQQFEPSRALGLLDLHYRSLEDLRELHRVEKVSLRGDRYTVCLGLREEQSKEEQDNPLTSRSPRRGQLKDTSPILLFAVEAAQMIRLRSILGMEASMSARFGFGFGECEGVLIAGASNVHYVLFGPAFDTALAQLNLATQNAVRVPRSLLRLAKDVDLETQDEPGSDLVTVFPAERSDEPQPIAERDSLPLLQLVDVEEQRSDTPLVDEPESMARLNPVGELRESSGEVTCGSGTNMEVNGNKIGLGSFWIHDQFAVQFLERQTRSRTFVFSAVLFGFILSEVVIVVLRESVSLLSGLLYLLAVLLTGINLLPLASTRMAAFGTGLSTTILLLVAAMVGPGSTVDRSAERLVLLALHFTVTSVDGVAPGIGIIISCSLAAGLAVTSVVLSFGLRALVWNGVGLITGVVVSVSQAIAVTEAYKDLSLRRHLLNCLSAETDRMEQVLRMLLPPYIVPIVVEKQRGNRANAIADIIGDAALLIIRLPPQPSLESLETICWQIDALVGAQRHVFLLHLSGDTVFIGGPAKRPALPSTPATQALASTVAGRALGRKLLNEQIADVTAHSLVMILSRLTASTAELTAVLNRGDATAVVFGVTRPTFSIEGKLTEETLLVLNACPVGALCVTSQFFQRYPEPSELEACFECAPETRWAIRSAGSITVRTVKPKPLPALLAQPA